MWTYIHASVPWIYTHMTLDNNNWCQLRGQLNINLVRLFFKTESGARDYLFNMKPFVSAFHCTMHSSMSTPWFRIMPNPKLYMITCTKQHLISWVPACLLSLNQSESQPVNNGAKRWENSSRNILRSLKEGARRRERYKLEPRKKVWTHRCVA